MINEELEELDLQIARVRDVLFYIREFIYSSGGTSNNRQTDLALIHRDYWQHELSLLVSKRGYYEKYKT